MQLLNYVLTAVRSVHCQ